MKKLITLTLLATLVVLAGCSDMETPVGIGSGRDQLKKSPCACMTIYDYRKGGWLDEKQAA